ncbi:MAG: P-II family nitrogen regulator [Candidatus Accumulibacter sp.]|jgi:nitrogen regulatory protein PII|nr:P-II family nitrogen regulator [Accumulibacter sp.]
MENAGSVKALFIIVNMGFGSQAVEVAQEAGAEGAVVINAVGTGMARKSLMGIPVESEKEIVLTLAGEDTAGKVVAAIKERLGVETPAHGICLILPVGQIAQFVGGLPPTQG